MLTMTFDIVSCDYRIRRPFMHLVTLSILKQVLSCFPVVFSGRVFPHGWRNDSRSRKWL